MNETKKNKKYFLERKFFGYKEQKCRMKRKFLEADRSHEVGEIGRLSTRKDR